MRSTVCSTTSNNEDSTTFCLVESAVQSSLIGISKSQWLTWRVEGNIIWRHLRIIDRILNETTDTPIPNDLLPIHRIVFCFGSKNLERTNSVLSPRWRTHRSAELQSIVESLGTGKGGDVTLDGGVTSTWKAVATRVVEEEDRSPVRS